jgi:hypothetical protein
MIVVFACINALVFEKLQEPSNDASKQEARNPNLNSRVTHQKQKLWRNNRQTIENTATIVTSFASKNKKKQI